MTIVAIILGWMLINTWVALIWAELDNTFISGWDEYLTLFVMSIVSAPVMYFIGYIVRKIKKTKKMKHKNKSNN